MAITRAQIAKQLLEQGGRVGLRGGGADMGTVSTPSRAARDNREIGARMDRTKSVGQGDAMRRNKEAFQTAVGVSDLERLQKEGVPDSTLGLTSIFLNSKPVKKFRNFVLNKNIERYKNVTQGPYTLEGYKDYLKSMRDRFTSNDDNDDPIILPPQGIMAEAPSDMDQEPEIEEDEGLFRRFRAEGGRAAFRGGDAAKSDAASGRDAGRADPSGGVDDRSNAGQTAVNDAAIMMAQMQNQNLNSITNPKFIEKFPSGISAIDNINLDRMMVNKNLNNITTEEDEDEKSLNETLAGFIQNQPEFQSKINDTISGIMANPDLAALGTITQNKADGGRIGLMEGGMPYEGGIMDLESARQMYGLGKLVKKVTRSVKKIAKSPVGKLAIGAAVLGTPFGAGAKGTGFFGSKSLFGRGLGFIQGMGVNKALLGTADYQGGPTGLSSLFSKIPGGVTGAIVGTSLAAGFLTAEQEEEAQLISDETGIDIAEIRANPNKYLGRRFKAEGGSTEGKEPVAKKVMPLLDMDGQEKDYRETGGFVDMGRMEKADDVPARLSKNEFVFTADAVRNAGDGSVDKGAEVMYNMMKNLESGGDVSEESQGLEGARKMFQTSQRLEEVL